MDDLDTRLDALYAGPPSEFTGSRDQLARELRAAGRGGEADAVHALRRPSKLAAEVNVLARAEPARTEALVAAQAELAAAQARILSGEGDAAQLRVAEAAEAAALDAFGGDGRLRAALRVAARSEALRADLLRGRLTHDPEPEAGGAGLFALGPARPQTAPAADAPPDELARARRARAARTETEAEVEAEPEDEGERRAREERLRLAIAGLEDARRDEQRAADARDAARRAADEAERTLAALAADRDDLRARLEAATAAAAAQEPVAEEAAAALEAAEAAARAAARERDGAERAARRLADEGTA